MTLVRPLLCSLLAVTSAILPATTRAAPVLALVAAPARTAVVDVQVELDQADDEALAGRLRGAMVKRLNAEGVAVTKEAGSDDIGTITLIVTWDDDDNHSLALTVHTADGPHVPTGSPWTCEVCKEAQLLAMIDEITATAIDLLPAAPDEAAAGTTTDAGGGPSKPRAPLGAMGKAGVGVLAGGTAVLVAGAVLTALGTRESFGDDPETVDETNFRPPGIGLIAGGAAAMITGTILLVVDRRRARQSDVALAPTVGPRSAGLTFVGRF